MKKIIFQAVLFAFIAASLFSQTLEPSGQVTVEPVLAAQGFAFQGKDFKTVRMALIEGMSDEENAGEKADGKLHGKISIAGFGYKLKVVTFEEESLTADLFCRPENTPAKSEKKDKARAELEIPVGHISIKLSQPDPGSLVWLGTLRLTDEKVEAVSGTFDLYLNDITPLTDKKPGKPDKK